MNPPRIYLIDGNNVMGQRVGWHRDRAGARRRLVREVSSFCRSRGVEAIKAVVVFDGSPGADEAAGRIVGGVRVVFAGPGSDADGRIVELASTMAGEGGLLAVTSDRELRERLAEHGVRSIRSGEFRRMLGD